MLVRRRVLSASAAKKKNNNKIPMPTRDLARNSPMLQNMPPLLSPGTQNDHALLIDR